MCTNIFQCELFLFGIYANEIKANYGIPHMHTMILPKSMKDAFAVYDLQFGFDWHSQASIIYSNYFTT